LATGVNRPHKLMLCLAFWAAAMAFFSLGARAATGAPVGVLVAREIAPYITMVTALEVALGRQPVQRFFLDEQGRPFSLEAGQRRLNNPQDFSAVVAVGPESLTYLSSSPNHPPLIYAMVLNPPLSSGKESLCGLSLNLPIAGQLQGLRAKLPGLKHLGVLFDPANNQLWFDQAQVVADQLGLLLQPVVARRAAELLQLSGDLDQLDALLFIPDKTVISQAVIQYVIKQAAIRGVPVIGYNQFFLDSGAALAFVIDYAEIGRQVAAEVQSLLSGQSCAGELPPAYELRINQPIWQALGLPQGGGGQP